MTESKEKNYSDLKVLDFSRVLVGPYLTQILCDMGAEVIKVERPGSGSDERGFAPIAEGVNGPQSGYFMMVNRGKKSVVLDLRDPDCREVVCRLIQWADVIVENFSPGVMDRLGFGYDAAKELNPRIIYCSLSVFGQTGPDAQLPGYDIIAQAMSGLMWLTGEPDRTPMRSGTAIGDVNASGYALGAIGAALYYRERTGKGQHIDLCLRDCLTAELETGLIRYTISRGQDDPMRCGAHHATMTPYGVYRCSNGRFCVVVALTPGQWRALCRCMGTEEWGAQEKFRTSVSRGENQAEVINVIETWLQSFENFMDAIQIMREARIPCAPIMTVAEVANDPQWRVRGNMVTICDPVFGEVELPATPMIFSETSVYNDCPPPMLGEHTAQVLREIACMPEETVRSVMKRVGLE